MLTKSKVRQKANNGIPEGWEIKLIEELAAKQKYAIAMGPFGSNITKNNFKKDGVPVIRGNNLSHYRFSSAEFVYLTETKADELKASNAFPRDIVITHRGTLGQVGLIPNGKFKRYVVSQSQMKLTCDENIANPEFVFYFLKSPQGQHLLLQNTSQTGVPAIAQPSSSLKKISVPLPSMVEQIQIAQILSDLDAKIELNRRMNETLEQIVRAIFKKWFLDFEFPGHEKTKFVNGVPEGWRISKISDEFKLTMGQSPPGETYNENGDGMPFFQGRTDFGFRYPSIRMYCNQPTRFAQEGDALVSVRAPVGAINMADRKCCIGRGLAAIRHKSGSRSFSYYCMRSMEEIFKGFEAEGTVFGSLTKDSFGSLEVIIPLEEIVARFEETVCSLDQKIENNEKESQALITIRDALLPKLMSGEIRVK